MQPIDLESFIKAALAEARLAYEFGPNSYSYGTFAAIPRVQQEVRRPDWIAEMSAWMGGTDEQEG
jgi:hypothetical protein